MLRKKLNSILSLSDPARYGNRYWTYSLSKDWLELIVPHHFRNDPDAYRIAVIHCGQVIKAITASVNEDESLQVKTFPDLDKSHIVAMIRDTSNSIHAGRGEIIPCPDTDMIINEIDLIRLFASCYNFEPVIHHTNNTNQIDSLTDDETKPISSIGIYSRADNPMVWLKTGYFLECLSQTNDSENLSQLCDIDLSLHVQKKSSSIITPGNQRYRQLLLKKSAL
jgi:hypothetical protein